MNIIFIISSIENLAKCILYSYIVIDLTFFALDTLTHICYVYATVDVDISYFHIIFYFLQYFLMPSEIQNMKLEYINRLLPRGI